MEDEELEETPEIEETNNEVTLLGINNESEENNMADTEIKKIKRSAYASFLNVGTTSTPSWKRMGQGISEMSLEYNAEEGSEKYIHQDSATHMITGYAPEADVEQRCYKGEDIFEYVEAKRRARAVESDAETQILDVFMYDKKAEGVYAAELNEAIVVISSFSGESISYAVKRNGDPVQGHATITNGTVTFTPGEYNG